MMCIQNINFHYQHFNYTMNNYGFDSKTYLQTNLHCFRDHVSVTFVTYTAPLKWLFFIYDTKIIDCFTLQWNLHESSFHQIPKNWFKFWQLDNSKREHKQYHKQYKFKTICCVNRWL